MCVRDLKVAVEAASSAELEDFGYVLGRTGAPGNVSEFFDDVMLRKPVRFVSDDTTVLSLATVGRRPFEIHWLERHFKHTQTFIPLGGRPFVLAMAKPSDEFPAPEDIRAFLFDGSAGFTMKIGTWHEFPFALVDATDVVVILREETNRNLKNVNDNEASGEDLDKRDVVRRTGCRVTLEF
jgi:ureidoglycolate lyase